MSLVRAGLLPPPPKSLTILVDTRERTPLLFPSNVLIHFDGGRKQKHVLHAVSIKTESATLSAGDYQLSQPENFFVIERKAGLRELSDNLLSSDCARQYRAFSRLKDFQHRYLLIEESPSSAMTAKLRHEIDVWETLRRTTEACLRFGLTPLYIGTIRDHSARLKAGEFLCLLFLAHLRASYQ